jgi:hypothetical protein
MTAIGKSGKSYAVRFEADDAIEAELMCRDCLDGHVDGTFTPKHTAPKHTAKVMSIIEMNRATEDQVTLQ